MQRTLPTLHSKDSSPNNRSISVGLGLEKYPLSRGYGTAYRGTIQARPLNPVGAIRNLAVFNYRYSKPYRSQNKTSGDIRNWLIHIGLWQFKDNGYEPLGPNRPREEPY